MVAAEDARAYLTVPILSTGIGSVEKRFCSDGYQPQEQLEKPEATTVLEPDCPSV